MKLLSYLGIAFILSLVFSYVIWMAIQHGKSIVKQQEAVKITTHMIEVKRDEERRRDDDISVVRERVRKDAIKY